MPDEIRSRLDWYSCLIKDYKEDDFIYVELKGKSKDDCINKLSRFIRNREYVKIESVKII
jgi:hypothetical protein